MQKQTEMEKLKPKQTPDYAWFEGEVRPYAECRIGLFTHALQYGTACFGGIRAYWNDEEEELFVFRLRDHYKRFTRSAALLRIKVPPLEVLEQATLELLRKEGYRQDVYIRPLAYKSAERILDFVLDDLEGKVAIGTVPFGRYLENDEGLHCTVSSWRRIDDNAIPARGKLSGAYVNSALARTDAKHSGFAEAILLNADGHVAEGSAENIFIVRDGRAITPALTENILEGITRATIIQLLQDELHVHVEERRIDRTELLVADEVFFCGTGVQLEPITRIDHRPIGTGKIGPLVNELRPLFFDVVRGKKKEYRHWLTKVGIQ